MLPGDRLPVDGTEGASDPTKGGASLKSAEEILSTHDDATRGNTVPTDLIITQPLPAAPVEASEGAAGSEEPQVEPQVELRQPCPRCGLSPALSRLQGSSLSVQSNSGSSRRSKSRDSLASSHQPAAAPGDSCLRLVLACLSCQCSLLLLGLLEACSSCLHTLCSSCCHGCARCCSALREAPVEELNCHAHCHSVLFESCCEPTECLEFCLECCNICHHS